MLLSSEQGGGGGGARLGLRFTHIRQPLPSVCAQDTYSQQISGGALCGVGLGAFGELLVVTSMAQTSAALQKPGEKCDGNHTGAVCTPLHGALLVCAYGGAVKSCTSPQRYHPFSGLLDRSWPPEGNPAWHAAGEGPARTSP